MLTGDRKNRSCLQLPNVSFELIASVALGGLTSFLDSAVEAKERGYKGSKFWNHIIEETTIGLLTGLVGGGLGASALKASIKNLAKDKAVLKLKEFSKEVLGGVVTDLGVSNYFKIELQSFRNAIKVYPPIKPNIVTLNPGGR